jgi:hypothetical protein
LLPLEGAVVALEDRDWYRQEASAAWWREAGRASRRSSTAGGSGGGRASSGLLLAVLVSAAFGLVAWKGYVPLPAIHIPGGADAADTRTIELGTSTGFDVIGPAGREWCITAPTRQRVCANTGTAETGRQALTRVLEANGYSVTR